MAIPKDAQPQNIQRSILVLLLALSVVILLTAAIFESSRMQETPAAMDIEQQLPPEAREQETQRAKARALMLANEYLRIGRFQMAVAEYSRVIALENQHAEALQGLATAEFRLGRLEDAERHFSQLPELLPRQVASYSNLAIVQLVQDKQDEAMDTARAGLAAIDPANHGPLHLIMACLYQMKAQPQQAAEYIQLAESTLGDRLPIAAHAAWAAPLREHPLMQAILRDAPDYSSGDGPASGILPPAK